MSLIQSHMIHERSESTPEQRTALHTSDQFIKVSYTFSSLAGADGSIVGGEEDTSVDIDLAYALCHLMVLCSACVNPIVYGWFNDTFRVEFLKILCCPCCTQLRATVNKLVCCVRGSGKPGVPSITLTKATNGSGIGGGLGAGSVVVGEEVSGEEKLSRHKIDEDSTTVNFMTVVTRVS